MRSVSRQLLKVRSIALRTGMKLGAQGRLEGNGDPLPAPEPSDGACESAAAMEEPITLCSDARACKEIRRHYLEAGSSE